MEDGSSLFSLNLSAREQWLMHSYGRPYFCTRLASLFVLALGSVPACLALMVVHGWLLHIGLLRVPGMAVGSSRFDSGMVVEYAASAVAALALGWLALGLWMFRWWAWWLAMIASLLGGLYCLFGSGSLWLLPAFCAIYALLLLSYPIFGERLADAE